MPVPRDIRNLGKCGEWFLDLSRDDVTRKITARSDMEPDPLPKELSREDLYELVWTSPATKLAAQMGISDVAFAKRCNKLNIPRPPRGYWAKLAAGRKPAKKPLPASEEDKLLGKDQKSSPVQIPENNRRLHPAAQDLLDALREAKPDAEGLAKASGRSFPSADVSTQLISHAARCVSSILTLCEQRGVPFKKARSSYDTGYFERKRDQLHLVVKELEITVTVDPATQDKRRPPWDWKKSYRELSKKLTFTIGENQYARQKQGKSWSETDSQPIEETIQQVVDGICGHFVELDREREREVERRRIADEEYKRKREEERRLEHKASLEKIPRQRSEDFLLAAEWWRLFRNANDFIECCEQNWRLAQAGALTEEQQAWLVWAREQADALSPFRMSYPDPAIDGDFDPESVPYGDPTPPTRKFPRPPTMPEITPPSERPASWGYQPDPKPYPFWLKHPRR